MRRGDPLDSAQIAALKSESAGRRARATRYSPSSTRVWRVRRPAIRAIDASRLNEARAVGTKKLPTTVGGLLVHVADHTQRHAGQAITTAKFVRARRQILNQRLLRACFLYRRLGRDLIRQLRIIRKISKQLFSAGALGDGFDQIAPTDETALPRLSDAAENFFAVSARANRIPAHLKSAQFRDDFFRGIGFIASQGRNQAAIRKIHFRNKFCQVVDHHDGIDGSKRLAVIELGVAWNVQERRGRQIRGNILVGQHFVLGDRALEDADRAFAQALRCTAPAAPRLFCC